MHFLITINDCDVFNCREGYIDTRKKLKINES